MEGPKDLERLYMEAAPVVDGLSLKILSGGADEEITEHMKIWADIQRKMGYRQILNIFLSIYRASSRGGFQRRAE